MTIFKSKDCSSAAAMFDYSDQSGYSEYSRVDLDATLIGNDQGNSVMVPAGYQVDLYQHQGLSGAH